MKAAVVVFPGINRENDMVRALQRGAGATVTKLWHTETALPAGTDLVVRYRDQNGLQVTQTLINNVGTGPSQGHFLIAKMEKTRSANT